MRFLKNRSLFRLANSYLIDSSQPINLSYLWNFGSLLAFCLIIQIITGVTLAMHYNPSVIEVFNSVYCHGPNDNPEDVALKIKECQHNNGWDRIKPTQFIRNNVPLCDYLKKGHNYDNYTFVFHEAFDSRLQTYFKCKSCPAHLCQGCVPRYRELYPNDPFVLLILDFRLGTFITKLLSYFYNLYILLDNNIVKNIDNNIVKNINNNLPKPHAFTSLPLQSAGPGLPDSPDSYYSPTRSDSPGSTHTPVPTAEQARERAIGDKNFEDVGHICDSEDFIEKVDSEEFKAIAQKVDNNEEVTAQEHETWTTANYDRHGDKIGNLSAKISEDNRKSAITDSQQEINRRQAKIDARNEPDYELSDTENDYLLPICNIPILQCLNYLRIYIQSNLLLKSQIRDLSIILLVAYKNKILFKTIKELVVNFFKNIIESKVFIYLYKNIVKDIKNNPPKAHAFTSLPLQSSGNPKPNSSNSESDKDNDVEMGAPQSNTPNPEYDKDKDVEMGDSQSNSPNPESDKDSDEEMESLTDEEMESLTDDNETPEPEDLPEGNYNIDLDLDLGENPEPVERDYNSDEELNEESKTKYDYLANELEQVRDIAQKVDKGETLSEEDKKRWDDAKQDPNFYDSDEKGSIDLPDANDLERQDGRKIEEDLDREINECKDMANRFKAELNQNSSNSGPDSDSGGGSDESDSDLSLDSDSDGGSDEFSLLPICNSPVIITLVYIRKYIKLHPWWYSCILLNNFEDKLIKLLNKLIKYIKLHPWSYSCILLNNFGDRLIKLLNKLINGVVTFVKNIFKSR